jgi:riboflavin synthase alpha subunit
VTTLDALRPGQELNLEVDVLARYVERCLALGKSPAIATPAVASTKAAEEPR